VAEPYKARLDNLRDQKRTRAELEVHRRGGGSEVSILFEYSNGDVAIRSSRAGGHASR